MKFPQPLVTPCPFDLKWKYDFILRHKRCKVRSVLKLFHLTKPRLEPDKQPAFRNGEVRYFQLLVLNIHDVFDVWLTRMLKT